MIPLPFSYQGKNIHRVVITQQTLPATDFERVEDLTADAIAHARAAAEAFESFPNGACPRIGRRFAELQRAVERRSVLGADFQTCVSDILSHLARLDVEEADAPAHDTACRHFREALNLSHRVNDLLAADRDLFKRLKMSR